MATYTCTECKVTYPDANAFVGHQLGGCDGRSSDADRKRDDEASQKAISDMLASARDLVDWSNSR